MAIDVGSIPTGLEYSTGHLWVKREQDTNLLIIGMTDYGQRTIGNVGGLSLPDLLRYYRQDESFGMIDGEIAAVKLFFPVAGMVDIVNPVIMQHPMNVTRRPYGLGIEGGWFLKINPGVERIRGLMSPEVYAEFIVATAPDWI